MTAQICVQISVVSGVVTPFIGDMLDAPLNFWKILSPPPPL